MPRCARPASNPLPIGEIQVNGRAPYHPGNLHPGGFGACPVALMREERASAVHLAVYVALASCVSGVSGEGSPHLARVAERARCSLDTTQRRLRDLEEWGYVHVERTQGCRSYYTLNPTATPPVVAAGSKRTTPPVAATPPCECGQTPPVVAATPQIPDQIQDQTRGAGRAGDALPPATGNEAGNASPAPLPAGGRPPSPPLDLPPETLDLLTSYRLGLELDPTIAEDVAQNVERRGLEQARLDLDAALRYGLRPRRVWEVAR